MEIDREHASIMLKRQFENGICRDQIELIAEKDNQKFSVPRLILTAASNYFAASLGTNFREGSNSEFLMEDTDGTTLKSIIDFLYTGCINLTEENVGKFFAIASGVALDLLEDKCCRFYLDNLDATNAIATWVIADKFNNANLCQKAFDFVCESFEDVPAAEIQELEHRLLLQFLKSDKIRASEELVLDRLLNWMKYKESDREQHMPELLRLIQLKRISPQFLDDKAVAVYQKLNCFELLLAEYQRRASGQFSPIGSRRGRSIYCFVHHQEEEGCSVVKVEKYHSALNSWSKVAEIPLGFREHFRLILLENKLYVLGGVDDGSGTLNSVSAYDLSSCEQEILPEMNTARGCFASTVFGKFIYVFGGCDYDRLFKKCERFDTETRTWEEIKPMNVARNHAVATVMNDYIVVAGGKIEHNTKINVVELYDPKSDEWVQIAPMSVPRHAFALAKSKKFLLAIGKHDITDVFNPQKHGWSKVKSFAGSDAIQSAIEVNGECFVIDSMGNFGKISFDENDGSSFVALCQLSLESDFSGKLYLSHD